MQILKCSIASLCHLASVASLLFCSEPSLTKIIEIYLPSIQMVDPPHKRRKEKYFAKRFLQLAQCFGHFRLLCTVTVEHLILVEPFTLLEMLCDIVL